MSPARSYPEETAGPFRPPPETLTDETGARVQIEQLPTPTGDDLEELIAMYDAFDPADRAQGIPPIRPDDIRAWLELVLTEGIDVIARRGDAVVGHATLVPDDADGYELAIFVHQDHRRQGIGSALVRSLLGAAAEAGIERIWLTVERWNHRAISLYESVGFRPTRRGRFELEMVIRLPCSDSEDRSTRVE